MIDDIVSAYIKAFPDERGNMAQLIEQIANEDDLNNRKTLPGHITGGAIVLSPDRKKLLVIHHNLFNRWLQPGGHWDPDEGSPWEAACREAEEETQVQIAEQLPAVGDDMRIPLDIGVHPIPPRPEKDEPAHTHYDFRYVFLAKSEKLKHLANEVSACEWVAFDDVRIASLQPIIAKLRRFNLIQ
jgi:8-oxo-dGTP pyrophosphatase MutT (NUDIX family)